MELVGALVLFLVSLLISAAKYNNFTKAAPVETGWVLVRDTVNMFFIVILLVVAFSNIVGYKVQEFGVKAVLPKLLMMAVLINFSKTLVGVMIDFSQVVMLTFVNGFQAAAGGNFIKALNLTKVTELSHRDIGKGESVQSPQNLLMAAVLGLAMLSISAMVLLVIIIYILMRIVGLWITLIFAPIAFFALALPSKIQNVLQVFTKEWWSRLSALLTGGPIVAFFLWLSLATVQGSPSTFGDIYKSQSESESTAVAASITEAGTPENLASFVVAIVMLLVGLSAAISSARGVSEKGFGAVMSAKGLAIRGAARVAKTGVRLGVGAAAGTARFADRQLDLTGRLGKRLSGAAERAAAKGGLSATLLAPTLARAGARASAIPAARKAAAGKELEKATEHMSPTAKMKYMETMHGANASGFFANPDVAAAANERALKIGTSRAGKGIFKNEAISEYYKANGIDATTASVAEKNAAKAYGDGKANRVTADRYDALKKLYESHGKFDELGKLEEEQAKNPAINNDIKGFAEAIAKKDYQQVYKETKVDAYADSATAAAIAKTSGFLDASGKPRSMADIKASDQWEKLAKSPERARMMEAQLNNFSGAGAGVLAAHLAEMNGSAEAGSSASQRYHMDAKGRAYATGVPLETAAGAPGTFVVAPVLTTQQSELMNQHPEIVSGRADYTSTTTISGMAEMARSGVPAASIAQYDNGKGTYASEGARGAYTEVLATASAGLQLAAGQKKDAAGNVIGGNYIKAGDDQGRKRLEDSLDVVANLDVNAIKGGGQYVDDVVQNIDLTAVQRGMVNAGGLATGTTEKAYHAERVQKIGQVVSALGRQAEAVVKKMESDPSFQPNAREKKLLEISVDLTAKGTKSDMKGVRAAAKRGGKGS